MMIGANPQAFVIRFGFMPMGQAKRFLRQPPTWPPVLLQGQRPQPALQGQRPTVSLAGKAGQ